ncbi:Intradiol ring-cleavage dioxygenase [Amylocarpus encephaloides]|uniref:Intradiol ring-cleavage dioxygenase n=1 Tax=Amylocarpus encephaloides TaxID=45428 RepID=A0A9P7YBA3_9HELO|nr:Intradiol ring-cleavage dioxygenase [Amylocarpus encephaloides]
MKTSLAHLGLGVATLVTVLAHGPAQSAEELQRRDGLIARNTKLFSRCAAKLDSRANFDARISKTHSFVNGYLQSRGLEPTFDHRAESVASCILAPEQEEGPFYVSGELIRDDIRESEVGIDLLLEVQLMNVRTCEPLKNVLVDFWSCNVTGSYAGIPSEKTAGETFLRGLAASDEHGIVRVYVMAHVNYTISNNTITGGAAVHTGQLLFDQSTLSQINAYPPYTTNTNVFTPNTADYIITQQANKTEGYQAFLDMTMTGKVLSDGVLGKMVMALDPETIPKPVGGGGPGGFPPGGFPTGGFPGFPTGTSMPPVSTGSPKEEN